MLLAALALIGQAPAPHSEREAMQCAIAGTVVNANESVPRMRANAETAYYVMQAAQAGTPTDDARELMRRFGRLAQTLGNYPPPISDAEAQAQIRACDVLFPLARKENVTLPADRFAGDMLCIAILPLVEDFATALAPQIKDAAEPLRWKRVFGIMGERLNDEVMAEHGYDTKEKMTALFNLQLPASLKVGNMYAIARACEVRANS